MKPAEICQDEGRRRQVRERDMNGLDYLEVSEDQLTLTVYFLGQAPPDIRLENVRLTGGRRVRDIQILEVRLCLLDDPERDDCLKIFLDKFGDYSTYTLCLVDLDEDGHSTDRPMPGFDPRYACLDFSFKVNCPTDLDCLPQPVCPPEERPAPQIDYLAKDYSTFRRLVYDRLALIMPDWKERHAPDLGVTLVELLAYSADYLSYYQDAVATEAYLDTARKRISLRRHARLVDYLIHEGCNARAFVFVETGSDLALEPEKASFLTRFPSAPEYGTVLNPQHIQGLPPGSYLVFEPLGHAAIQLYQAHNRIRLYTWGDSECCLPRGGTRATLLDEYVPGEPPDTPEQKGKPKPKAAEQEGPPERVLRLQVGDYLLFEEVIGPETGNPLDADPARRHVVRLTRVELGEDPLYPQSVPGYEGELPTPVVEVEWEPADALPFPLCISVTGPAPDCKPLVDVSVARGNLLLVDHGQTFPREGLGVVPLNQRRAPCTESGCPSEVEDVPGRYRPSLDRTPLTFGQPLPGRRLPEAAPATQLQWQEPRQALPHIWLHSIPAQPGGSSPLFTLAELNDPTPLAMRLGQPEGEQDPMYNRISQESRELLAAWSNIDDEEGTLPPPPAGLLNALRRDLEGMLQEWAPRYDLLGSGDDDTHYVVEMDEEGRAHLRFGDGELGRRPQAGSVFIAGFRVGNGPSGNVGAETIQYVLYQDALQGATLRPRNPLPAAGGTDREPLADIRLLAPYAFRAQLLRAITAEDYARLAEEHPGVQRAAAELRWTGSWYEARVALDALGAEEPSTELLEAVAAQLHRYRRIGHDLRVLPAGQVPLAITLEVCVAPDFLRGHVQAALLEAFSNRRLPDGRPGFFHADNLTFGEGVFLSRLVATAQAVPGVESVLVTQLERLFEGPDRELEDGLLPLGALEIARLDNDPGNPENGQLKLVMRGGR